MKRNIVITAYGPFGGCADNPTSAIAKHLQSVGLPQDLTEKYDFDIRILDVCYETVDAYIRDNVATKPAHFYVHLGFHPSVGVVKLEKESCGHGYDRDDVKGCCPSDGNCTFAPKNDSNQCQNSVLTTSLNCEEAVERIKSKIGKTELKVETSTDCGRYLCAYIYFCTLRLNNGKSLFVHVPEFDNIATLPLLSGIIEEVVREVDRQIL